MAAQERVQKGQVSRAREELVGSPLAHQNEETLRELRERRPQAATREIPREVLDFAPPAPLGLNFKLFPNCLRSAQRGWMTKKPFNCCQKNQPTLTVKYT